MSRKKRKKQEDFVVTTKFVENAVKLLRKYVRKYSLPDLGEIKEIVFSETFIFKQPFVCVFFKPQGEKKNRSFSAFLRNLPYENNKCPETFQYFFTTFTEFMKDYLIEIERFHHFIYDHYAVSDQAIVFIFKRHKNTPNESGIYFGFNAEKFEFFVTVVIGENFYTTFETRFFAKWADDIFSVFVLAKDLTNMEAIGGD